MSNIDFQENTAERQRLITLVNRLTDDELRHPLEAGWTVAGVLAHLAFWDQRALILLQKWQREGITPSAVDVDVINEATRELCITLVPHAAVELALAAANAIDYEIERLLPEFSAKVEADGKTVRLNRALHRRDHLTQIEQALKIS